MTINNMEQALDRIANGGMGQSDLRDLVIFLVQQVGEHRRGFHKANLIIQGLLQGLMLTLAVIDKHGLAAAPEFAEDRKALDKAIADARAMFG